MIHRLAQLLIQQLEDDPIANEADDQQTQQTPCRSGRSGERSPPANSSRSGALKRVSTPPARIEFSTNETTPM